MAQKNILNLIEFKFKLILLLFLFIFCVTILLKLLVSIPTVDKIVTVITNIISKIKKIDIEIFFIVFV